MWELQYSHGPDKVTEKLRYMTSMGSKNVMPEPWKAITQEEYLKNVNTYHAFYYQSVQIVKGENFGLYSQVYILYNHEYGYGYEIRHDDKVRFLRFGCAHEYETKNVGRCLTQYTCKKCGLTQTIDSSD
jgi:hypothetical protein